MVGWLGQWDTVVLGEQPTGRHCLQLRDPNNPWSPLSTFILDCYSQPTFHYDMTGY